jgi:hypothetical protein
MDRHFFFTASRVVVSLLMAGGAGGRQLCEIFCKFVANRGFPKTSAFGKSSIDKNNRMVFNLIKIIL